MANTITSSVLVSNSREVTLYVTIQSDGTEETATVVYDSSAVVAELAKQNGGIYPDPLTSRIMEIYGSASAAAPVVSGGGARVRL